jgi:hypothetical protein
MLFISLVLLFACYHDASAETPGQPGTHPTTTAAQPAAQTDASQHMGPQVDPCYTLSVAGDTWLDQVHGFVQDNSCEPAVWFDAFFMRDHVLLDLRPGALIIFRNSPLWTEGHTVTYVHDLHIEWELPQSKQLLKKWKLYLESSSNADKYTTQPGQPVQPGVDRETGARQSVVGVRADLYTRLRSLVSIDSGLKISLHPDAFIRMRYQYLKPFSEVYLIRFSEIAMWQAVEHFTNTVQLDLEKKISTFKLVRWGNNVTYLEGTSGVTWNSGISLLTQLTPKSAISYDTSVWGVNHPDWVTQNYRIGSLYRRNFYRPWLFFELSPEVTWPKDASGKRNSTYAFMATLEIQFGK